MIEFLFFVLGLLMMMEEEKFKMLLGLLILFNAGHLVLVKYSFLAGSELGYALTALALGLEGFLLAAVAFYFIKGVEF